MTDETTHGWRARRTSFESNWSYHPRLRTCASTKASCYSPCSDLKHESCRGPSVRGRPRGGPRALQTTGLGSGWRGRIARGCGRTDAGLGNRRCLAAPCGARGGWIRAHLAHPDAPEHGLRPEDLPYALAFGMDRTFLRRLESVGSASPAWYSSPAGGGFGVPGSVVILPGGFRRCLRTGRRTVAGAGTRHSPGAGGFELPGMPNPQGWSDSLSDLLNGASDALAAGDGSGGWSGGGFGGCRLASTRPFARIRS
jgi:hypothetical protein